MNAAEIARTVVDTIEERKGEDIVMLDLREISPIADYFVIATSDNERMLNSLIRSIDKAMLETYQIKAQHVEGNPESGWVLLDYSWVIIHLFSRSQREFYRLELLWSDAPVVLRIQ